MVNNSQQNTKQVVGIMVTHSHKNEHKSNEPIQQQQYWRCLTSKQIHRL